MWTRRIENLHVREVGGWSNGLVGNDSWGLNMKQRVQQGSQIKQHFTRAQPQPALTHGQATMEGLLENKMACEKCRTETKRNVGDSHKN